jgi:O-antigen/teichoic acid export membrane protein
MATLNRMERGAGSVEVPAGSSEGLAARHASIGDKALRGSVWMVAATGTAKAVGFACQLMTAWFLTKQEFGVYAIAVSLSVLMSVLRDGGLPMVLEQKGRRFDLFAGPVFWMMLTINLATGMLIALIARPAAQHYQIPELDGVMTLFAISVPLSGLPAVLYARLNVNLKFRELGLFQVASATIRNALLFYFAWKGYGARSFILPLLITNVTDTVMLWMMARYSPWAMKPRFHLWGELFRSGRWVLLGTFAIALGNNGAYFLLANFLPSDVLGTYFFAYQLVFQLGVLLAENVYQVLVASFIRIGSDLARLRSAVRRSLGAVVLVGAAASLSIAAVYEPIELILWHGKWSGAAQAIHILGLVWPAAAGISVVRALQMATGHFRQWGVLTLIGAVACVCGTVIGAYLGRSAASAAIGFGIGTLFGAALNTPLALATIEMKSLSVISSALRPWLTIAVAALCANYLGHLMSSTWPNLVVSVLCFLTFSFVGLRLFANDSFPLVLSSLRHILVRKGIGGGRPAGDGPL